MQMKHILPTYIADECSLPTFYENFPGVVMVCVWSLLLAGLSAITINKISWNFSFTYDIHLPAGYSILVTAEACIM